jgi:hypothetical protein
MTETAIAIRETSAVVMTETQLNMISRTEFVPQSMRGNLPAVLACVAMGRALGLPDMVALNGINVIQGRATLAAETMGAIARAHGHSITGTVDDEKAVVRGKRGDNGDEMEATFTLEMAKTAGLLGNPAWKKHPDDMMWARAVSKLCRRLFPDCFAGATYTPDDLIIEDGVTADELMDDLEDAAAVIDEQTTHLEEELLAAADVLDVRQKVAEAMADRAGQDGYAQWLDGQLARARETIAQREASAA